MKSEIEAVKRVVSNYGITASKLVGLVAVLSAIASAEFGGLGFDTAALIFAFVALALFHFAVKWSRVRQCYRCGVDHYAEYRYCPQCGERQEVTDHWGPEKVGESATAIDEP